MPVATCTLACVNMPWARLRTVSRRTAASSPTARRFCSSLTTCPPIRLAALSRLHVIHVVTHDSIALGGDGPTHQPVEQLANLRAIPNLTLLRPADANETAVAWQIALETKGRPVLLVLTRRFRRWIATAMHPRRECVAALMYSPTQRIANRN
jgi:transketolase